MQKSSYLKVIFLIVLFVLLAGIVIGLKAIVADKAGTANAGNQSFFEQFFIAGGPIVWFVLFPMSLVMVYLFAQHALTIRRKVLAPCSGKDELAELAGQADLPEFDRRIAERSDLVSTAIREAFVRGRGDWIRTRSAIAESLQEQAGNLLRKVEWLNLIGNVSPMVGLFGTVYGMIKLFNAIVVAGGQPQPAQLADGISVALVTTFWGLFIAIPAIALHGIFRNRIEELTSEAVVTADEILPKIQELIKQKPALSADSTPISWTKVPIRPVDEKSLHKSPSKAAQGKH